MRWAHGRRADAILGVALFKDLVPNRCCEAALLSELPVSLHLACPSVCLSLLHLSLSLVPGLAEASRDRALMRRGNRRLMPRAPRLP